MDPKDTKFIIVIGILALITIFGLAIMALADRRRKSTFAAAVSPLGFHRLPEGEPLRLPQVPILEHAHRSIGPVLQGRWHDFGVFLFDISYRVAKSGSQQTVVAFLIPQFSLPKFQLRENSMFDHGWEAYADCRVKFPDSPEFDRRYALTGPDAERLQAFFRSGLLDVLLAEPENRWTIEGYGNCLAFYRHGSNLKVESLSDCVQQTGEMAERILGVLRSMNG